MFVCLLTDDKYTAIDTAGRFSNSLGLVYIRMFVYTMGYCYNTQPIMLHWVKRVQFDAFDHTHQIELLHCSNRGSRNRSYIDSEPNSKFLRYGLLLVVQSICHLILQFI